MADLRARLADALREHRNCPWSHVKDESETWEDHVVDMLLSLPGIAIVELPDGHDNTWPVVADEKVTVSQGIVWFSVSDNGDRPSQMGCIPAYARELAAALLAAAHAAETPTPTENRP